MRPTGGDPSAAAAARTLDELHRFYAAHPAESLQDDALLCYVLEHNRQRTPVNSTHLVRCRLFGTLPTVTERIGRLLDKGLIRQVIDVDRRVRLIEVTPLGISLLEKRSRLIEAALGPDFAGKT